jgi:hypothetical protein
MKKVQCQDTLERVRSYFNTLNKGEEGVQRAGQEQIGEVTFAPLSCILCTASTTPSLRGSFRPTIPRGGGESGRRRKRMRDLNWKGAEKRGEGEDLQQRCKKT